MIFGLDDRERIVGVEDGVFVVLKEAAVEVDGAGLGDGGDVGNAGEFGVVVGFADADLFDGVEGGEHLVDGAGVFDAHAGNAVDGDAEQSRGGSQNRQVPGVVGLHAGFGGERGDGAGGAGRARIDGDGKLDQFVADLGFGDVGDFGSNDRQSAVVDDNDGLGFAREFEYGIEAAGFAGGERDERAIDWVWKPGAEMVSV